MPAAAVASRTPATGGISGKDAGARGDIVGVISRHPEAHAPLDDGNSAVMARLLLLPRRAGIERRVRRRRLIEPFDLGGLAQVVDQRRLGAVRHIILDLAFD